MATKKPHNLEEFLRSIAATARANFERDGELHPIAFVGTDEMLGLVPLFMMSNKDMWRSTIRAIAKETRANFVALATESWTIEEPRSADDIKKIYAEGKSIADHPDRKEILSFLGEDRNGKTILAKIKIDRDANGKATLSDQLDMWTDTRGLEGRFVGLIPSDDEARPH